MREARPAKSASSRSLWVHYFEPHSPCEPPDALVRELFPDDELRSYLTERDFQPVYRAGSLPVHVNSRYDGDVRLADEQLGLLLEALRSEPESWNRTIVIVLGDHGEGLGQHGEKEHSGVWDEHLHVPLVIRVPGVEPMRVDDLISIADVVPTLMGLVELPNEDPFLRHASGQRRGRRELRTGSRRENAPGPNRHSHAASERPLAA